MSARAGGTVTRARAGPVARILESYGACGGAGLPESSTSEGAEAGGPEVPDPVTSRQLGRVTALDGDVNGAGAAGRADRVAGR